MFATTIIASLWLSPPVCSTNFYKGKKPYWGGPPKSCGPRQLPTLPTRKAGPDINVTLAILLIHSSYAHTWVSILYSD